jgi:hypothetical protein
MILNFFIFILFYFTILFSIIGYGFIFSGLNKNDEQFYNFGCVGLFGIFFLILYSYLSHLFYPHSKLHNLILVILGICLFFYYLKDEKKKIFFKKNFLLLIGIFSLLFISILVKKNHDDFPYYHFQYTYYLTQESLNYGIGTFNHGFRTPSSIFYLNSLFYLPLAEFYLFNFAAVYILGFANIILIKKIFNYFNRYKFDYLKINFVNYFSLLIFIFINIFFYRISEHGTDRSAQILIMILFIFMIEHFQYSYDLKKKTLYFFYILIGTIISLKSFYVLYLLFFIPFFIFIFKLKKKNILETIKFIFFNKYFLYFIILISLILLSFFSNTGCLIYPISFTCFENFEWSIPKESVLNMKSWYELWSKGGANPNFRVQNPEIYIERFNWVSRWINDYFFNKVSDFLFGVLIIIFITYLFFYKFKQRVIVEKLNFTVIITYCLLTVIFFEWFLYHPALRYGGYCIIILLIFIPYSFYLDKKNISSEVFFRLASIMVFLSVFIFEIRNFQRIIKEIDIYDYRPLSRTFYSVDENYFILQKKIEQSKTDKKFFYKDVF